MKKALRITLIALLAAAMVASLATVGAARKKGSPERKCSTLKIEFADAFNFVTEDDVKSYLGKHYGNVIGKTLDSLDLARIEKILDVQSAILKSEAYVTDDGALNISITQREPVIRFQDGTSGFYIDDRGFIFPLQSNYTSHVPVIDGEIPLYYAGGYKGEPRDEKDRNWMEDVMNLTKYIRKHRQWSENIVQISVARNGDFLMVPRAGNEIFNIGEPRDIEKKFSRMEKYYQYIKPLEKDYTSVCVKYDKQIICK